MADIFISYARADREIAKALAGAFEHVGWSVWWDTRLSAGESFDEVIEMEIEKAKCVVVLWSKTSIKSRWVKSEANEGMEKNILIPVLIENVEQPLAFRYIHTGSLIGWDTKSKPQFFQELIEDISKLLDTSFDSTSLFLSREHHIQNSRLLKILTQCQLEEKLVKKIARHKVPIKTEHFIWVLVFEQPAEVVNIDYTNQQVDIKMTTSLIPLDKSLTERQGTSTVRYKLNYEAFSEVLQLRGATLVAIDFAEHLFPQLKRGMKKKAGNLNLNFSAKECY